MTMQKMTDKLKQRWRSVTTKLKAQKRKGSKTTTVIEMSVRV